jgi:hypothetical protein
MHGIAKNDSIPRQAYQMTWEKPALLGLRRLRQPKLLHTAYGQQSHCQIWFTYLVSSVIREPWMEVTNFYAPASDHTIRLA